MRNVIHIPQDLHQDFRSRVVVKEPRMNLGEAAEQAITLWNALDGKSLADVGKIARQMVSQWRKQNGN